MNIFENLQKGGGVKFFFCKFSKILIMNQIIYINKKK